MPTVKLYSSAHGSYSLPIVGEESYQHEIAQVVAYDGDNVTKFREDGLTAELIFEDNNPYDKGNAIRVDIDQRTVGYLSRNDARKYREGLAKHGLKNVIGTCYAAVYGRYNAEKEGVLFGVYLDLDVDRLIVLSSVAKGSVLAKPPNNPDRRVNQKKPSTVTKIPFSVMVLSGIVAMICQIFLFSAVVSEFLAPPTPIPTFDLVAAQNTAIAEAWVSYTQTMIAESTNNPLPTATLPPTETMMPTETASITPSPMPTATLIVFVTDTPFFLNLPANQPTSAPVGGTCPCSGDTLNCSDFNTHAAAQACYSFCVSQGAGDIHKLDGNNDGSACESLP